MGHLKECLNGILNGDAVMCSRIYIADSGEIKEDDLKDSAIPESFIPPSLRS